MIRKLSKTQQDELERIQKKQRTGDLTAKELLAAVERMGARSTLYGLFEWDDNKAGQQFREIQAGEILRAATFTLVKGPEQKVDVRKYHALVKGDRRAYSAIEDIMRKKKEIAQLKQQAAEALIAWKKKYTDLFDLNFVRGLVETVINGSE